MKKFYKHTIVYACCMLLFFAAVSSVSAASLKLNPTSVTKGQGQTFEIMVDMDLGSEQALATDAKITYDCALLEVTNIVDGTFLGIGKKEYSTCGQIYIAGIIQDPGSYVTGTGTLATITFKTKAQDGTATVQFVCTDGETATDSNIANNDLNTKDIIKCGENGKSTVVVGVGGPTSGPTNAPTSTPRPTTDPDDVPDDLPDSGIGDMIQAVALPGMLLVALGIIGRVLITL